MVIKKVGVLGCGLMGSGIAQVAAQAGYETVVVEVEEKFLQKGLAGIDKSLGKFVEKGKLSAPDKDACMKRLKGSTSLKDLADCDIVIEAIIENAQVKKETYAAIDSIVKKDAIFASNTSSLTITELSMATARPKQFVGLHFFNPVPLMKLVEVVRTILTSDESFKAAFEFAKSLGKEAVSCKDNSGFIVNRLLVPYLLDAVRAFEEGVGSVEDIDKAMMLGCGYPMGPFTLLDFVGLDTTYYITHVMYEEYQEKRFASPPLLRKMVLAGKFGRKSGAGFYDYSNLQSQISNLQGRSAMNRKSVKRDWRLTLPQSPISNLQSPRKTMPENIKTETRDGILWLTIDRPKVRNALNDQTITEIGAAFTAARDDDAVRAVVVTGAGDKAFVAGADINELAKMTPIIGKFTSEKGQSVFLQIERFPKPVIAAINGFALGGGCELALACHIRIASDRAELGLPEVSLGIIPGYGGTQRMVRLLGKAKAFELICTGDRVTATDALQIGLVNKVVPAEQLIAAAEEMAGKIASRSPVAVRAAIEAINSGSDMPFEEGQVLEATLFGLLCASEDMKEGMAAFLEKRPAKFPGK